MAGNKVKYSDLIQDDGALDRLLDKLEQTAATFEGLVSTARSSARDISNSLNNMSSATQAGRDSILAANEAVANLKSATTQLKVSISDTSQAVTGLKAAISENTTVTAKSYSAIEQAIGKYDKLKSDLQDYMNLYKSLTTQEKSSPFGQQTLEEITKLTSRVNTLTANLRALTKTQKERLSIDEQETNSLRKLTDAQSDANVKRYENNQALREANRIAALNAKLRNAEPGSYQAISAQYALNKIELSKLNVESETASERTRKLVADTYLLYQQMKQFQEATGVHSLSVGNYTKVWDGLGYSVAQVVREIPNAAIDMRTFFIAISNNLPILADQIMQVRKENEALRAQGEPTVSAIRQIGRALMSWNTILTVVLTVLNLFGDDIIKWIGSLFKGEAAVMSMRKAVRNLNKELENSNADYGGSMSSFKKLQNQWAALKTEAEKTEWIKNHEEAFEDLGLAITDAASAEQVLVNQADAVEETFRRRAEAAAATALATKEYEKALVANAEAERKRKEGAEKAAKRYEKRTGKSTVTEYSLNENGEYVATEVSAYDYFYKGDFATQRRVKNLKAEAEAAEANAEQYLKLGAAYDDLLDDDKKGRDSEGRDLTDRIYQARLQAAKKYNEAQTKLIKDEYDRRQRELEDAAQAEIETLKEQRRKAKEWRDDPENDYEELTAEEQAAIQEIISKSSTTILNIEKKLAEDVEQLELDRQINELKIYQDTLNLRLESVKEGSYAEMALREQLLQVQRDLELKENEKTIKVIKAQNAKAARTMSENFAAGLWTREGFSAAAYKDAGGNWTIGPGFTKYTLGREITEDTVITEEEAAQALQRVLKDNFIPDLNAVLDEYGLQLNQKQYDAFLDLSYQGSVNAVRRVIEDALDETEGLEHISQVFSDVGAHVGVDAAERFGDSFKQAYLDADFMERLELLLQAENLYTGGIIGGRDEKTGKTGVWYSGMQGRSDWRSGEFAAEPDLEEIERNKQLEADIVLKWNKKIADLTTEWSIRDLEQDQARIELKLQAVQKGSEKELELQKELLDKQLELDLKRNSLLGENLQKDETLIKKSYARREKLLEGQYMLEAFQEDQARIELKLQTVQKGTEEELELQKELLDKQLELDLKRNSLLGENLQKDETLIKKSYARRKKLLEGQYMLEAFQEGQAASRAQYIADNKAGNKGMKSKQLNDYYLGIYDQEQAIALLEEQIWQAEQGFLDWSPAQIAEAKANLVTLNRELDETKDIWNLIGEKGIGGGILTSLGFKDDQIDAFMEATNIVISQIQAIAQAEVDAAQKAVEAAQERVDAAKSAYDAEIEARNNGYANNVATAKKELEQEKKNQREKQKLLEAAQRNQARIDSAMQTSSLVTATANLWASYSKLGPLGQALTIAAIATMWGSFGAAKIKAKNVTSQEYGEGGLEFLEGGSHASGHDIDLGTVNSRGRRMRAEGGEAMAIINKRNTRKYKALLPGIVESLNAGNFEEKYLSSLSTSGLSLSVNNASIDLSKIEDDVADIKKQNQVKYYTAEGYLIVQDRNVKRIIKN